MDGALGGQDFLIHMVDQSVEAALVEVLVVVADGHGVDRVAEGATQRCHQARHRSEKLRRLAVGDNEARIRVGGDQGWDSLEVYRRLHHPTG